MLKLSALSQIWKKYIQKLNDWDLPLKHKPPLSLAWPVLYLLFEHFVNMIIVSYEILPSN